jgi:hypothetical protein
MLLFVIPFVLFITFIFFAAEMVSDGRKEEYSLAILKYFPFVMFIPVFTLSAWFWSMGITMNKYLPKNIHLEVKRFKKYLIVVITYFALLVLLGFILLQSLYSGFLRGDSPDLIFNPVQWILLFTIPIHLFVLYCIFYCTYFTAKMIKSVNLQREAFLPEYFGELLLIVFFFLGMWIIQPSINAIDKEQSLMDIGGDQKD